MKQKNNSPMKSNKKATPKAMNKNIQKSKNVAAVKNKKAKKALKNVPAKKIPPAKPVVEDVKEEEEEEDKTDSEADIAGADISMSNDMAAQSASEGEEETGSKEEEEDDDDENENGAEVPSEDNEEEEDDADDNEKDESDDAPAEIPAKKGKPNKSLKNKADRTNEGFVVFVKNLGKAITEAHLKDHFANCGNITHIHVYDRRGNKYALIRFKEDAGAQAATKLHNSVLNGNTINVYTNGKNNQAIKDGKHTIILKNIQNLDSFPVKKIEEIFGDCGEIEIIDMVCKANVLAFITFKSEEGVQNAFKLKGSTVNGLEINIEEYRPFHTNTTVFMLNVKPGTKEEDIREFFRQTGDILSIYIKPGFANVRFKDTDSFCKAFLLNEAKLCGNPIFLEPFSEKKKHVLLKSKHLLSKSKHDISNSKQDLSKPKLADKRSRNFYKDVKNTKKPKTE